MRPFMRVVPRQSTRFARPFTSARTSRIPEDKKQDPEEAERAKQNANQSKEARREVASSSEEVVGADQQKVNDHGKHMEDLQKQTAQETQENHPKANS